MRTKTRLSLTDIHKENQMKEIKYIQIDFSTVLFIDKYCANLDGSDA